LLSARLSAERLRKTIALAEPPRGAFSEALASAGFQPVAEPNGKRFWFRGVPRP